MLTKSDCLSILVKLEDRGININPYMRQLAISSDIPIDVLQFIVKNNGLEVTNFYEMLRKKHNQKKSPLYTNILKEVLDEDHIVTTLTCLLTQIVLYSNKLGTEKDTFLSEVRAEEITRVLNEYFKTGNYDNCLSVLKLIKTDLLVLEGINGKRDFIS